MSVKPSAPSRRAVVRGTAWAVPAVIVGTAAPAVAASGATRPVVVTTTWVHTPGVQYLFTATVTNVDGTPAAQVRAGMYVTQISSGPIKVDYTFGLTDDHGIRQVGFSEGEVYSLINDQKFNAGQGAAEVPNLGTPSNGVATFYGTCFGLRQ